MSEIKISIVTPCLNSEKTISRTIESVLSQNFEGVEYIIVDGASTDKTLEIIDSYKNKFDRDSLIVISEQDSGIYDAMNKGISRARGELIGIINSDDWYEENCLETVWRKYKELQKENVVIYGALNFYQNSRLREIAYFSHEFLEERMINHPTCFVTKNTYSLIGNFDCRYKIAADYEFMLRALRKRVEFVGIKCVLASHCLGGVSSNRQIEKEVISIRYRYGIIGKVDYLFRGIRYLINIIAVDGYMVLKQGYKKNEKR